MMNINMNITRLFDSCKFQSNRAELRN